MAIGKTFAAVSPSSLDWAEYGVQLGCRLNGDIELHGFANGQAGTAGVGAKLHIGAGVDGRF